MTEKNRIIQYSSQIRKSTIKKFKQVPEGFENWTYAEGKMTIADLAQHLIDVDVWLEVTINGKEYDAYGKTGLAATANRDEYDQLLERLQSAGTQREKFIESLSDDVLYGKVLVHESGKEVDTLAVIVRSTFDHEVHHRGQLSIYMNLLK